MPGLELSSNWKKLQSSLTSNDPKTSTTTTTTNSLKRKRPSHPKPSSLPSKRPKMTPSPPSSSAVPPTVLLDITSPPPPSSLNCGPTPSPAGRYLALDCEMVSTRLHSHSLARVSLTNYHHAILYDSFVLPLPSDPVTDYRTHVSGVTEWHLRKGYARPLEEVRAAVAGLMRGRVLVGHALGNDLKVLGLDHPGYAIRDTARYKGYKVYAGGRTPGLKTLAREVLGVRVQEGRHDSVVDARVAMELFRREKGGMEGEVRRRFGGLVERVGREVVKGKVGRAEKVKERMEMEGLEEEESDLEGSQLLDGESEDGEDGEDGERVEEEGQDKTEEVEAVKKKRKKRKRGHKSRTTRA